MKRIEVDLTEDEYKLLLFAIGAGCGVANQNGLVSVDAVVALTNKLFAASPGFIPYEVRDGKIERITPQ